MGIPSAVRIILIVLSAASFVPQYRLVLLRGNCEGLAPYYILWNLIVATQQFAIGLAYILFDNETPVVHAPLTLGDWLNFTQFSVVFLGHLVLFVAFLVYPPSRQGIKTTILSIFTTVFATTVGSVIFVRVIGPQKPDLPLGFLELGLSFVLNPIVSLIAVAAFFVQARQLRSGSEIGSLSPIGLIAQAIVYLIVGITWNFRMVPLERGSLILKWYPMTGFAVVDNLIFALAQLGLWFLVRRIDRNAATGETSHLLGNNDY